MMRLLQKKRSLASSKVDIRNLLLKSLIGLVLKTHRTRAAERERGLCTTNQDLRV